MTANNLKPKYLDSRTVERYIKKGLISAKDYEAYVKSLPDDEANGNWVQMDLHETGFADSSDSGDEV